MIGERFAIWLTMHHSSIFTLKLRKKKDRTAASSSSRRRAFVSHGTAQGLLFATVIEHSLVPDIRTRLQHRYEIHSDGIKKG
jgi:hypothetical protein